MLRRRRSKCLLHLTSNGDRFVEKLVQVGIPRASELHGPDFDWVFESAEDKEFLDWFCSVVVDEENILRDEEVQAYQDLLESGKLILDEESLKQLTKCASKSVKPNADQQEVPLEKLQEELQKLENLKIMKTKRLQELQARSPRKKKSIARLCEKEEECVRELNVEMKSKSAENSEMNNCLQQLSDGLKKLGELYHKRDTAGCPVFLSEVDHDQYSYLEDRCTKNMSENTSWSSLQISEESPSVLMESLHSLEGKMDSSSFLSGFLKAAGGNSSFLQTEWDSEISDCDGKDITEELELQLRKLQVVYNCLQQEAIYTRASMQSLNACLQWAEKILQCKPNKSCMTEEEVTAKVCILQQLLAKSESQVAQICRNLPFLIKSSSEFVAIPVRKGHLDLEMRNLQRITSKQDIVLDHQLKQMARFNLLQSAYSMELHGHKDLDGSLEKLGNYLTTNRQDMEDMSYVTDFTNMQKIIGNKSVMDETLQRIYKMLGDEDKLLPNIIQDLEKKCTKLTNQLDSLHEQLSDPAIRFPSLEADVEALYSLMYDNEMQVQLHHVDLSEGLEDLATKQAKLIGDLESTMPSRKMSLRASRQMERNLYVYFFQDPDKLKEVVEKVERKAAS
ncbi:HAUS augmin-like complex subunit 3 [Protopterus annectens]|uniref:HAUS augmin-like complex subunit 3 n=1 Tax=Protopterus annectens TaxID=7888 RepID=UPI001CF9B528|nr:HAUS augmin-like complex subunit 3 [Protopterus annectens]